jgi:hypothetical protein
MIATDQCKWLLFQSRRDQIANGPLRTFLKRKGGLFKKAHELSVLCSVDVAVIIFGNNRKLYEFSSGDIGETLRRYQYVGPVTCSISSSAFIDRSAAVSRSGSRAQGSCRLQE